MGYDLSNSAGTSVRFSGSGWDLALAVAQQYGWEPAGIPKPAHWNEANDGPWEDDYWMNAGQEVTASDAASLAAALDRAIAAPDFIETTQRLHDELKAETAKRNPKWAEYERATPALAEGFRLRLVEFAALAHQGPFKIE